MFIAVPVTEGWDSDQNRGREGFEVVSYRLGPSQFEGSSVAGVGAC